MNEQTTPTGMESRLDRYLAIVSANNRNAAPKADAAGITKRLSAPIIIRIMCGLINPMKPMMPEKDTMNDTIRAIMTIHTMRILFTLSPKLFAFSSPMDSRFSFFVQSLCHGSLKDHHIAI